MSDKPLVQINIPIQNLNVEVNMPAWDRQSTGIVGLEQDVRNMYDWVRDQNTALKQWLTTEIEKVTLLVATYQEAVNSAIEELNDLSTRLAAAIAANDSSGVQAAADQLQSVVDALNAAEGE